MSQPVLFAAKQRIFKAFATLIDYPESKEDISSQLRMLSKLFASDTNISGKLDRLEKWADNQRLGYLQEAYTGIFDINSLCSPYIGYYLFGEDYKRSLFITGLKEKFRAFKFDRLCGEMPDHLSVILRFLSELSDYGFYEELINDALLPSVGKMISEMNHGESDVEESRNPNNSSAREFYSLTLSALKKFLESEVKND